MTLVEKAACLCSAMANAVDGDRGNYLDAIDAADAGLEEQSLASSAWYVAAKERNFFAQNEPTHEAAMEGARMCWALAASMLMNGEIR